MKKYMFQLLVSAAVLISSVYAQYTPTETKQLLDGQAYVFEATWMMPLSNSAKQLTSPYFLIIAKDSIIADLPYSGKNNSATAELSATGIHFTSTKFSYVNKPGKTSWGITIKPKDDTDGTEMYLKVAGDGSATLQVSSNSKDRISYNGYVKPQ